MKADESPPSSHAARDERADQYRRTIEVAGVVVLALIVRLVYVSQTAGVPFVHRLVGDAAGYFSWAKRIAAGAWVGTEPFYQAPLYPYFLAGLFTLGGAEVWLVRVVQCLGGVAGVGLLAVAARNWFGRGVGLCSGIMLALYPPAIYYDGIVQKASLSGLSTCALLWLLSGINAGARAGRILALGMVAGLLALTRENALVWIPLLACWIALPPHGVSRRVGLRRVGFFLAGVMMILAPVAVRNFSLGGGLSPTSTQVGPNFYIGNHAGADGRYQPLVRGHETPAFERTDATRLAEQATGRTLTPAEVSTYWMSRAWHDIRGDPVAWVRLIARKFLMVLNDYEVADVESMAVYADASWALGGLGTLWRFGVLVPLAAIGIWAVRATWRRYWILWAMTASMIVAVAVFFVLGRYRFPLVPLLIPFAARGVIGTVTCVRRQQWRQAGRALLIGVVVAVVSNWPVHDEQRLDALARMNAGVALAAEGHFDGAVGYFQSAVDGFPDSPEANLNLAQALAEQGELSGDPRYFERAVGYYQRAASVAPGLPGLFYNLGVALERIGRRNAALAAYERAVVEDRNDTDARRAVQRLRR